MKQDCDKRIYRIIASQVEKPLLYGFSGGKFNDDGDKVTAYTYVVFSQVSNDGYSYYLDKIGGSLALNVDLEKQKKYIGDGAYQLKTPQECIEEGIYKSYGVRFIGMFYENDWYLMKELVYFGETVTEEYARNVLSFNTSQNIWDDDLFIPYENIKKNSTFINSEMDEFKDYPYLIAIIKQQKKGAVNHAFRRYMNEIIFLPFVQKMKMFFPVEYANFIPLYSDDYELIFPENKKHILMVAMVENENELCRIEYFFYQVEQKKIYKWTYLPVENYGHSFHYSPEIIEQLSKISSWKDYTQLNSSCTLDDDNFWNDYVLKQESGEYIYLQAINFNHNN